jgi:hypothetical protein
MGMVTAEAATRDKVAATVTATVRCNPAMATATAGVTETVATRVATDPSATD